jgi:hypothetical protein
MAKLIFGMNHSLGAYAEQQAFALDAALFCHIIEHARNSPRRTAPTRRVRDYLE